MLNELNVLPQIIAIYGCPEGPNPACTSDSECDSETESCLDGVCQCITAMRRSAITGKCEWLTDKVCILVGLFRRERQFEFTKLICCYSVSKENLVMIGDAILVQKEFMSFKLFQLTFTNHDKQQCRKKYTL